MLKLNKPIGIGIFLFCYPVICFSGILNKSEKFTYTYFNYHFQSDVELPGYEEIGPRHSRRDVAEFSIPDLSDKRKRAKFRLVLFRIPRGVEEGPLAKKTRLAEKLSYCTSIYLGGGPSKLTKKQKYKGKTISGYFQKTSIPQKGVLESYILEMEGGNELFAGFYYTALYSSKNIDEMIQTILSSISVSKTQNPETQFLNSFREDYRISSQVINRETFSEKTPRLGQDGLENYISYRFKSKVHIKGKKGYFLQFRLSVYKYNSSDNAELAFRKFSQNQNQTEEIMRSKSPMLSLLKDCYVYILDGSCLYSRANMNTIEEELVEILFPKQRPDNNSFLKRRCGGSFD